MQWAILFSVYERPTTQEKSPWNYLWMGPAYSDRQNYCTFFLNFFVAPMGKGGQFCKKKILGSFWARVLTRRARRGRARQRSGVLINISN